MKHKHADLIHAWADGAEVQILKRIDVRHGGKDLDIVEEHWVDDDSPDWDIFTQFRIKPEEKKPVVRWLWAFDDGFVSRFLTEEEAKNSGRTLFKIEWSRMEFPE